MCSVYFCINGFQIDGINVFLAPIQTLKSGACGAPFLKIHGTCFFEQLAVFLSAEKIRKQYIEHITLEKWKNIRRNRGRVSKLAAQTFFQPRIPRTFDLMHFAYCMQLFLRTDLKYNPASLFTKVNIYQFGVDIALLPFLLVNSRPRAGHGRRRFGHCGCKIWCVSQNLGDFGQTSRGFEGIQATKHGYIVQQSRGCQQIWGYHQQDSRPNRPTVQCPKGTCIWGKN